MSYSDYQIAFDGADSWSSDNDDARNVVIFGVDNCSSSPTDNLRNIFECKLKGQLMVLVEAFANQSKSLVVILVKEGQNVA